MMDVMKTNVPSEPLQHARQTVIRAAFERRSNIIPAVVRLPIGMFELVLNEKQPATDGGREHENWKVNEQEGREADGAPSCDECCQNPQVRYVHTTAFAAPGGWNPKCEALPKEEQEAWTNTKQKKRVAIYAVLQAAEIRTLEILVDGENPHVAMTAVVEVATAGMVPGMTSKPQPIGRKRE